MALFGVPGLTTLKKCLTPPTLSETPVNNSCETMDWHEGGLGLDNKLLSLRMTLLSYR